MLQHHSGNRSIPHHLFRSIIAPVYIIPDCSSITTPVYIIPPCNASCIVMFEFLASMPIGNAPAGEN